MRWTALALAATCSLSCSGSDAVQQRTGETPPVVEDCEAWLALCREIGWAALQRPDAQVPNAAGELEFTLTDGEKGRLQRWMEEPGTPELAAEAASISQQDGWEDVLRRWVGSTCIGEPILLASDENPEAIHAFMELSDSTGEPHPSGNMSLGRIQLSYERIGQEWRVTSRPVRAYTSKKMDYPTVEDADVLESPPPIPYGLDENSVIALTIREFEAGAIPLVVLAQYQEMGIALDAEAALPEVLVGLEPVYFPGSGDMAPSDPDSRDEYWRTHEAIVERLPEAQEAVVAIDRTLAAARLIPVLRVLARPEIQVSTVFLSVAERSGALRLEQPSPQQARTGAMIYDCGTPRAELKKVLRSGTPPRGGVRIDADDSLQDLVDTLVALRSLDVPQVFVVTEAD